MVRDRAALSMHSVAPHLLSLEAAFHSNFGVVRAPESLEDNASQCREQIRQSG